MSATIETARDGRITRVRYDNATRGNALDQVGLDTLVAELETAAQDPTCAVILLQMAGLNFCGGWDTSDFAGLSAATVADVAARLRSSDAALQRIRDLEVPVVTAVRGHVIGVGAGLLLSTHIAVADRSTRVSLPEVRFGFAPAGVAHQLVHNVPSKVAYPLLMGALELDAEAALCHGMVTTVVEADELDATVQRMAETLAAAPGDVLRSVTRVIAASVATGSPETAFQVSAASIVSGMQAPVDGEQS